MYALRERDGSVVWSYNSGTLPMIDRCKTTYGIDSTAALSGGRLFFGNGLAQLTGLNATTGQLIWRSQLADPAQAFHIWASPLVFDGKIYIGLASHCVNPCVTGRLVCVDASNGQVLWSFGTAPEGSLGGAVWSSAAVDAGRRMIYVGTGNYCTGTDLHSTAIIALNADTGALLWRFKRLPEGDLNNLDFGASPVLFDISGQPAVAVPSKDGHCYALNRATGELIWDTVVNRRQFDRRQHRIARRCLRQDLFWRDRPTHHRESCSARSTRRENSVGDPAIVSRSGRRGGSGRRGVRRRRGRSASCF